MKPPPSWLTEWLLTLTVATIWFGFLGVIVYAVAIKVVQ